MDMSAMWKVVSDGNGRRCLGKLVIPRAVICILSTSISHGSRVELCIDRVDGGWWMVDGVPWQVVNPSMTMLRPIVSS